MNYAGFWIRIIAGLIDDVIWLLVEILRMRYDLYSWEVTLLDYVLLGIYYVFFWKHYNATPGMMLMRIKITVAKGEHLSLLRAIIRYIGLQISVLTIIGGLWMIWDKQKQMWHDKFAGTYVVRRE